MRAERAPASGQPDLYGSPPLLALVDQYEAGARIFSSSLKVAEGMGLAKPRAIRFASDQARRACGIDWEREVRGTEPATRGPPAIVAGAVATFVSAWQSGTLGLPWGPALSIDAHTAYQHWARREGEEPRSVKSFVLAAVATGRVRKRRTSWRSCRKVRQPSFFLVPDGHEPVDAFIADWLGSSVAAFRRAAKAASLA